MKTTMIILIVCFIIFLIILVTIAIYVLSSSRFCNTIRRCGHHHPKDTSVNVSYETNGHGMYKTYNPSIVKINDGYLMCVRYSNLTFKTLLRYLLNIWGKNKNDTKLAFVHLSKDLQVRKMSIPTFPENCRLEDPRIIEFNDLYYITCTESSGKSLMFPHILVLNKSLEFVQEIQFNREIYFGKNEPQSICKNWCLFAREKELFVHTDCYPRWKVFKLNKELNTMALVSDYDVTEFFDLQGESHLRCSTSWKGFTECTYICGIHTKTKGTFGPSKIRTMIVEINKDTLKPIRVSPILCFDEKDHSSIQFLSGLELIKDHVVLSFGVGDFKCGMKKIPRKEISRLLSLSPGKMQKTKK